MWHPPDHEMRMGNECGGDCSRAWVVGTVGSCSFLSPSPSLPLLLFSFLATEVLVLACGRNLEPNLVYTSRLIPDVRLVNAVRCPSIYCLGSRAKMSVSFAFWAGRRIYSPNAGYKIGTLIVTPARYTTFWFDPPFPVAPALVDT